MATNRLHEIEAQGTAIWIDTLSRELLDEGTLERLIADDGVTGVTSNPTIFKKAMEDSERYDRHLREAIAETSDPRQVYFRVAFADTRDACDLLRPVFERTEGRDGYVSFELPPDLAYDVEGSIDAAAWCRDEISRPNVLIKVPGTEQGVRAFEELTANGVNVNVTLLFSVRRYEEIGEAYLHGLERRVEKGQPIERSASVASFFVSRVDTKIDQALEERGRPELRGMAAVANAKLAYASFARMFAGERWQALQARGARVQRPLWASTSTKNPAYPDTLYVDELIGPDTVSTMPDSTLAAARDHATAERSIDRDVEQARAVLEHIRKVGVDADEITLRQLVDEGVKAFADSFEALIDTIEGKIRPSGRTSPSREYWIRGGAG
jgi:transaldolase